MGDGFWRTSGELLSAALIYFYQQLGRVWERYAERRSIGKMVPGKNVLQKLFSVKKIPSLSRLSTRNILLQTLCIVLKLWPFY